MRWSLSRHTPRAPLDAVADGPLRVDVRTKNLTKRLRAGDIAVIDHEDLDRVSAEALVACGPVAVVNASPSISGRYPNAGPMIIVEAGIPLLDVVGSDIMTRVSDGQRGHIVGDRFIVGRDVAVTGVRQDVASVEALMRAAHASLPDQLESFVANTLEYLKEERDLLVDGVGVPEIRTDLDGRHVLIVVRGYNYKEDLAMLRPYIREYRPVLIGVDGGADAILEEGLRPDLIVGDMDSVSDTALRCGAEIVVHAYRDGVAPGLARVETLGLEPVIFPALGTSEDVAMLLADDLGASLIVAVGTHATLVEFLDKGRAGMSSTFLTRLRVGSKLIDAKGVSRLYRPRISVTSLVIVFAVCVLALVAALFATPGGRTFIQLVGARLDDVWSVLQGLLP